MWQANVFTIFPMAFPGTLGVSLIGKALEQQRWRLNLIDLKQFPVKSDRIDDKPYGGGAGMVLSPEVFAKAFDTLTPEQQNLRRIYFSPRGRQFTQQDLKNISETNGITILCGRYEGIDQRIIDYYQLEEVSIGDFVLMGGEVAAMAIIEGCVRLLPQIVGNSESIADDSFQGQLLESDIYTQPACFRGMTVPSVLQSGHHERISRFRLEQSQMLTRKLRPDLWGKYVEKQLRQAKD